MAGKIFKSLPEIVGRPLGKADVGRRKQFFGLDQQYFRRKVRETAGPGCRFACEWPGPAPALTRGSFRVRGLPVLFPVTAG